MSRLLPILVAMVALLACEGTIGGRTSTSDPDNPGDPCADGVCEPDDAFPAATSAYPRLSHGQYENTLRDLFGLTEPPGLATTFESDPSGTTAFDNDVTVLQVTPNLWQDYQTAAETMAERLLTDAEALGRLTEGLPAGEPERTEAFAARFLRQAFRRPVTTEDTAPFVRLANEATTHYPDAPVDEARVVMIVQAALQSPHFLYRDESGEADAEGLVALDDHQLASRLSYTLWDSMPDDELFRAAEAGELTSDEGLRAQAARMLDDPKAATKIRSFHSKLFDLGHYEDVELEGYPEDIGHTLRAEAEAFIDDVLLENDGGIRELYTAPYTYVNEDTAPLYGLEGTYGPELERAGVESDRS